MGYWYDTFGKCNEDFIAGVIAGVTAFAVWKNGQQVVGVLETPLHEELDSICKDLRSEELT